MPNFNQTYTSRKNPSLDQGVLDRADDLVESRQAPHLQDPKDTARRLVKLLQSIRSKLVGIEEQVDRISPLSRITVDPRTGTTFYHLSTPARELLRSQHLLPWGP